MSFTPRFLHSLSIRRLLVLGFGFAILPVGFAVASLMLAVEELAALSHATITHVAQESRQSRALLDRLTDLERRGRQYLVLNDEAARTAYEESHNEFTMIANQLLALAVPEDLTATLRAMVKREQGLFQSLTASRGADNRGKSGKYKTAHAQKLMKQVVEDFQDLHVLGSELSQGYSAHVDAEAEGLSMRLLAVQQRLLWQAALLLPVGLMVITFFLLLILRPIRRMDQAIRTLGNGEFSKPISIAGPRDLNYLGTRLEWLRTRLLELEQAKQRFMRNVSHEIKTPLANLHEGVELLADEVVGELNPEQREISRIVIGNAEKLETLIAELMQYGRVNARVNLKPPEQVEMRRLVEGVIEDYQLRLRNNDITVHPSLQSATVVGNGEQLRTVVDNLLSNAVKYSPPGGRIDVTMVRVGDSVELEIEDDGPGIDSGERQLIFEPFYQGRAAREFAVKGSGFGLAIVAECVAAHRGAILALDPRNGRTGARIRVQIPQQMRTS